MIELKPKYNIGQLVYHVTPDSERGIITDITWRMSSNIIWYSVTFNVNSGEISCRDFELTIQKTF